MHRTHATIGHARSSRATLATTAAIVAAGLAFATPHADASLTFTARAARADKLYARARAILDRLMVA